MVIYIESVGAYKDKHVIFFEIFNEVFIMILNYHLFCFADFIPELATQ